ncbi:MAG: hypothetical protein LBE93_13615 [Enterobacter asburiae]|jgi:hypothetical protein|nr:hypothetical protein [Enterobacter asburiae]
MTTLTEIPSPTEKVRFTAGLFLFSGLVAQIILVQLFTVRTGFLSAVALTVLLLVALAGGFYGARWGVFRRKPAARRIFLGYLISAAGMLLLLLASQGLDNWVSLIPGIIISGTGQGMVFRVVTEKNGSAFLSRLSLFRAGLLLSGTILSAAICLVIPVDIAGKSAFTYAFALLLDLSLLAATYARITEQNS